ncbi:MAG: DMT family transporter [Culturomica sp.]|jgi:drug/metabolite transporter (DMT)-like permease|nr:DMT family transporter [Culturomica sp.]
MKGKKSNLYNLLAILVVMVWGLTFISTKVLIISGLSPEEIFVFRFLIAYVGIWCFSPRKLFANSWKDEMWLILGGITGGSLYFWAENQALGITQASNVAFIVCTAPLFTAIFARMLYKGERTGRNLIIGSLLALTGMAFVVYNGSFVLKLSPVGDLLSLVAAVVWALYSLIMRKLSDRYDTLFITRKIFFYGLLTILPVFIFSPWQTDFSLLIQPSVLLNLLFLGVIASLICYALWNVILKHLGTVRASNYIYLNPLFTLLGSALWLQERITYLAIIGSAFIIIGVYLAGKKNSIKN